MREAKKDFSRVGFTVLAAVLAIQLMNIIIGVIIGVMAPSLGDEISQNADLNMILSMVIQYGLGSIVLYLGLKSTSKNSDEVVKTRLGVGSFLKIFAITYTVGQICNILGLILTTIIASIKGGAVGNVSEQLVLNTNPFLMILLTVICAPIFEEFFFRKMIIDRVGKYGEKLAIITSGLMFGLFHGNLNQFMFAFGIGVIFAYVYTRTSKIHYTIILHGMINSVGAIMGILIQNIDYEAMEKISTTSSEEEIMKFMSEYGLAFGGMLLLMLLIVVLIIYGIIAFCLSVKKIIFTPRKEEIGKGKRFGAGYVNVGMISFIVIFAILIILQLLE